MNSLKISEANFESTVDATETLVVRFVPDDTQAIVDKRLSAMFPNTVFAHVNVDQDPSLARMFSLDGEPAVAVFRQRIILFFEKGQPETERLVYLLQQISMLDMDKVRLNIEKEKAAQALHMRRVCPTVRSRMFHAGGTG